MPSAFEVLNLQSTATFEEVKARFRELALEHHPDKNIGHEEQSKVKFIAVRDAYEYLEKRLTSTSTTGSPRSSHLYAETDDEPGAERRPQNRPPHPSQRPSGMNNSFRWQQTNFSFRGVSHLANQLLCLILNLHSTLNIIASRAADFHSPTDTVQMTVNRLQHSLHNVAKRVRRVQKVVQALNGDTDAESEAWLRNEQDVKTVRTNLIRDMEKWSEMELLLLSITNKLSGSAGGDEGKKRKLVDALRAWEHRCWYDTVAQ